MEFCIFSIIKPHFELHTLPKPLI